MLVLRVNSIVRLQLRCKIWRRGHDMHGSSLFADVACCTIVVSGIYSACFDMCVTVVIERCSDIAAAFVLWPSARVRMGKTTVSKKRVMSPARSASTDEQEDASQDECEVLHVTERRSKHQQDGRGGRSLKAHGKAPTLVTASEEAEGHPNGLVSAAEDGGA